MACTACGVCLESCPTYTLTGLEAESPRGRIALIEAALAPGGGVGPAFTAHIDSCLGCMACMRVCPEDVDYPSLLAQARPLVDAALPAGERLRRRVRLAALDHAGRGDRLRGGGAVPHFTPARGEPRGRVGLLLGCTQRLTQIRAHQAAVRLLSAEGYEVIAPRLPDCCGARALQAGAGFTAEAHARRTIAAFASVGGVDHVLSSSVACAGTLGRYGDLLQTADARAFAALATDLGSFLAAGTLRSPLAPLALRAVWHSACQSAWAAADDDPLRALLARVPELELIAMPADAGACCGAPGIYSSTQPDAAAALGARQAAAAAALGADVLLATDDNCTAQLKRHLEMRAVRLELRHPLELLAYAAGRARGVPDGLSVQ